jgi:hypothetical protein
MDFPQYRKYKNGKSFFKILSNADFEEYQLQFGRLVKHEFKVNILPDRNYIEDMLYSYQEHWDKIEEDEFNSFLERNNGNATS